MLQVFNIMLLNFFRKNTYPMYDRTYVWPVERTNERTIDIVDMLMIERPRNNDMVFIEILVMNTLFMPNNDQSVNEYMCNEIKLFK